MEPEDSPKGPNPPTQPNPNNPSPLPTPPAPQPAAEPLIVKVPALGESERPPLSDGQLDLILSGLLIPSQGASKALAREVKNLRELNAAANDLIARLMEKARNQS
jgi:hypothetical protein